MTKKINFKLKSGPRQALIIAVIFALSVALLTRLTEYTRTTQSLSYSQFLSYVESDKVKSVHLVGQEAYGLLKEGARFEVCIPQDQHLWPLLKEHQVEFSVGTASPVFTIWYFVALLMALGILGVVWLLVRQSRGGSNGGGIFSMGKSKAKMFLPSQIKVNFNDVAGAAEAKEELQDIIEFLKNPEKYKRLGAKLTKGVLLVGEPGNGKTLLAKAVAGEANCPFFSVSGSDFIEVFVGVGSARMKDLFAQARKHAPSIVFIDEIDAIGRQRGAGLGGGNDEREQTLNQLLIEMDGFESSQTPIIVLAATNIPDVLDKALLRPGRFDRRIDVPFPDEKARLQILKIHSRSVRLAPEVDLSALAQRTAGFSAADLANLINQAALNASRSNRDLVQNEDIQVALTKLLSSQESIQPGSSSQKTTSRARMYMPSQVKVTFADVAGALEAKEELHDVIDFLREPEKYQKIGARLTKGVLLVGDPGNGKTLLAKAVAGEAHVPFFSVSGSEFVEVYVGVGAARVRDLFAQARKHAPCIVFIDEIDAIGRKRSSSAYSSNDEREATLNQLLVEMDGFDAVKAPIIVMAATNRADVLDAALLRAGRFDRRVTVPYPDLICREQILKVHARNVKMDPSVNLHKVAQGTPGFSGASLANLINEAAINAVKHQREMITIADVDEARDKIILGKESKSIIMTPQELKVTAVHEAGHALVRLLMPQDTDPLYKITIIPRGSALGVTHFMPERDKYMETKEQLIANVMAALGGRAAEELVFGHLSTGASSDFQRATTIVRNMICHYGMSEELGMVIYGHNEFGATEYSQETARKIDHEIKQIIEKCYHQTMTMLKENREKLDLLSDKLLEKETLFAEEVYKLLGLEARTNHSIQ